jgi:hypothetical protein
MRRREFVALVPGLITAAALAQGRTAARRVGFLYPGQYEVIRDRLVAFNQALTNPEDQGRGLAFEVIARFG